MSTIKSSTEHLTLNADGSGKDIKFQANGVEKASISSAGAFTSTSIDATKLSGTVPNFTSTGIDDNATSTAITIDSAEKVTIGTATAATNVELSLNGVTGKAQRIEFAESGVDKWLIGQGAASETDAFEIYNANGQMSLSIAKATSDATIVGNLVIGTSGKGIDFSATSDGSGTMTSEVLDDYEEGTWSPVWTPDSGTIVTNTTYTGGVYTKVGNLVTVHCRLYTNSVSSPTGKITISGLPYAIKNSPYTTPYVLWPLLGLNGSLAGMPIANTLPNTTTLQLSDWSWGTTESGSNIADKFDADVWCHAGLTYMTN